VIFALVALAILIAVLVHTIVIRNEQLDERQDYINRLQVDLDRCREGYSMLEKNHRELTHLVDNSINRLKDDS
jgi:hypothetical protein